MLHFILSGVGGGKTTKVMEIIRESADNPVNRMTMIVPEQFSFTCQKSSLEYIGAEKMTRVDVLSFTELGDKLLGRPAFYQRKRLTESAASVLMSFALSDVKDELILYKRQAEKKSAVHNFLSLSSEFKQSCISTDTIKSVSDNMEDGLLKAKLHDIALILKAFDSRVAGSYFNPDDILTELAASSHIDAYFSGRMVFIDSFRGFTADEYEIIRHILNSAEEVYVTLCTYDLDDTDDITDLFAKTKNTAGRIKKIADSYGVKYDAQLLTEDKDRNKYNLYASPELTFLEKNLFSPTVNEYDGECNNIELCTASDIYLECSYTAAMVKKLIRSGKYRCRDIAIIARNISDYEAPLRSALRKCGISLYEDNKRDADTSPVINFISAVLAVCAGSYDNDSVMRYLKTGLTGISDEKISEIENYCFMWRITGRKWTEEWTNSPDGFGEAEDEKQRKASEKLESLNETRKAIIAPIEKLKKKLKGGIEGEKAVSALWNFIEEVKLSDNLKKLAGQLNDDGEIGEVKELSRMWDVLIDLIDEMNLLLCKEMVTAKKLSEIFELQLSSKTVGSIPQGLDEVIVGSADRIRMSTPKVAFVIGANEGVFPPDQSSGSALTMKERKRMEELGISLSETGDWKLADEKLITYSTLCCAREKLYVSCIINPDSAPCEFYNHIKRIFPGSPDKGILPVKEHDVSTFEGLFFVESLQTGFEEMAKSEPGILKTTLSEYFENVPEYKGKIESLGRISEDKNFRILDNKTAEELFGKQMTISPSRVETYYECPFKYFCKYGIKAYPRGKAELNPQTRGNITHYVLEHIISGIGRDKLMTMTEAEIKAETDRLMDEYYSSAIGEVESPEFRFMYDRLKETMLEIVLRITEEFECSDFIPVRFEMEIGGNGPVPEYIPENSDGSIKLGGRVDRVDVAYDGDKCFLRIVDYKSKQKEFSLCNVINGKNLQMLIYLFALWKNGSKEFGNNIIPAGILYYYASTPVVDAKPENSEEDIAKSRINKQKMTGIILDNAKVAEMMDRSNEGKYIPVKNRKNNVINIEALKKLESKIDELTTAMARSLRDGNIPALPSHLSSDNYTPCTYCDYASVCGHEDGNPEKVYEKDTDEKVIEKLMEGDETNGTAEEK